MKTRIKSIVMSYDGLSRGKKITIIRENGLLREYPYKGKHSTKFYLLSYSKKFRVSVFDTTIHIVRIGE